MKRSSFGNCLLVEQSRSGRGRISARRASRRRRPLPPRRSRPAVTRRPAASSSSRSNFSRRLDQRRIAARGHVIDDGAGGALDIGRNLALGGEKVGESLVEIGAAAVEANGHGGFLRRDRPTAQWRGGQAGRQPLARLANDARRPGAWPQDPESRTSMIPGVDRCASPRNRRSRGMASRPRRDDARLRRGRWCRDRRCRGRSARIPGIRRPAAAPRHGSNSSSALPPGARRDETRSRPVPAPLSGASRSMLRDLQASTRSKRRPRSGGAARFRPTASAPSPAGSCRPPAAFRPAARRCRRPGRGRPAHAPKSPRDRRHRARSV